MKGKDFYEMKEPKVISKPHTTGLNERPLVEILDILNHPENHKDVTWGEFIHMASELGTVGNLIKNATAQQTDPCATENRFKELETRIKSLENKFNAIYEAFTGGDDYD